MIMVESWLWLLEMPVDSYSSHEHTEEHIQITRFHKYLYLPQLYHHLLLMRVDYSGHDDSFFLWESKVPLSPERYCSLLLMFSFSCQWHLCPLNDQLASPKTFLLFSLTTPGTTSVGLVFLKSSQDRIRQKRYLLGKHL